MRTGLILAGLAALAILPYLPTLAGQPFIADDFVNIWKARDYATSSGWKALREDPVHLFRPVLIFPAAWILRAFGPWPPAFYALSILLHVCVTWLIFSLGSWKALGWRVSALAAAFFAVQEGHQEAVMWFSAVYEPFLAAFLLLSLLAWIKWLAAPQPRWPMLAAALAAFLLALASKESAVMLIPLLLLPLWTERVNRRRGFCSLPAFLLLALIWYGWMFLGPIPYPRLGDGSFSFRAPFAVTWVNSLGRMLWPYGALGLLALLVLRARGAGKLLLLAAAWISVALAPYCFLLYMPRVPSRQTYVASIGLGWIVAAAFLSLWERASTRKALLALAGAAIISLNVGYVWTRKRSQFLERAASTEALIRLARHTGGPIIVERFPFPLAVAQGAVLLCAGKPPETIVWKVDKLSRELSDYRFSVNPEGESADLSPATR